MALSVPANKAILVGQIIAQSDIYLDGYNLTQVIKVTPHELAPSGRWVVTGCKGSRHQCVGVHDISLVVPVSSVLLVVRIPELLVVVSNAWPAQVP